MPAARKSYTEESKRETVALVEKSGNRHQAARRRRYQRFNFFLKVETAQFTYE